MKAELLLHERHQIASDAFAELRIWRVPQSVRGSGPTYKYALAYIVAGECVFRYGNEPGKGDHKHIGAEEVPYLFITPARLWPISDPMWMSGGVHDHRNALGCLA